MPAAISQEFVRPKHTYHSTEEVGFIFNYQFAHIAVHRHAPFAFASVTKSKLHVSFFC